jgi:hypothetical protein
VVVAIMAEGSSGSDSAAAAGAAAWRNPTVVFFHMAFRCAAVLAYVFCSLFSSSFTVNFITCVTLLAFDFWTVKNVSGRLLVGLRWWNEVNEDGTSKWRFESHEVRALGAPGRAVAGVCAGDCCLRGVAGFGSQSFAPHPSEARLFWWTLYLFTGLWGLLLIFAVIRFQFSYAVRQRPDACPAPVGGREKKTPVAPAAVRS